MNDDFEGAVIVDTFEEEFQDTEAEAKKGCITAMAILLAIILVVSAAFPLARFIIRKNYENQVENFPGIACENLLISDFYATACDPSLHIIEFVDKTFPIGAPKSHIKSALTGFAELQQSGENQPGCQQPELWTYMIASSFIGWKTEVVFLFCSETLVDRMVLVDGAPVSLPTYDL